MGSFLESYFKGKSTKHEGWRRPIAMIWLEKNGIDIEVFERRAKKLYDLGAMSKLKSWLLSEDDIHFISYTAERYIIDYLIDRNQDIQDNLFSINGKQTDARLARGGREFGIEVTTINTDVAEWIFIERLPLFLEEKGYRFDKTIVVSYNLETITDMLQNNSIYQYIQDVGYAIIKNDNDRFQQLMIGLEKTTRSYSCIVWEHLTDKAKPLKSLDYLVDKTLQTIERKKQQLATCEESLLFIGVNQVIGMHPVYVNILSGIGTGGVHYKEQINRLEEELRGALPENILGMCYFVYSISSKEPYYPLKIIWRDINKTLGIQL